MRSRSLRILTFQSGGMTRAIPPHELSRKQREKQLDKPDVRDAIIPERTYSREEALRRLSR